MDSQTIRTALGTLQAIPDSEQAWATLRQAVAEPGGDLTSDELVRLLLAARFKHVERGEWNAVADLLEVAAKAAEGAPREAEIVLALAKALSEELFDDEAAAVWYLR